MKFVKRVKFLLLLPIIMGVLNTAHAETLPQYRIDFENLPRVQRQEFITHINEAKRLLGQQRIFETLDTLHEAARILPDHPMVLNYMGACYIEFRDFKAAEAVFLRAEQIMPNEYSILFNIGEINFVTKKWKQALKYFKRTLQIKESEPEAATYLLAEFKAYICDKKLGNPVEKIENKYNFSSDNPAYYYINAVKAWEAGHGPEASIFIASAAKVYKPDTLNAWTDTITESGYLSSVNGDNLNLMNSASAGQ